jgi:hypothetical protein
MMFGNHVKMHFVCVLSAAERIQEAMSSLQTPNQIHLLPPWGLK